MPEIAIRDAFGEALHRLGAENPNVVALESDVGSSTKSSLFGSAFPDRYFNVGIAELNMTAMAAGFALNGMIPFVNTFASFLSTRASDPINSLIAYDRLSVKLCGAYCGLSDSYDGASHHSLSDIAIMRSLPNMTVISPCDAIETHKAVFAAANYDGPVYLRLSRAAASVIYSNDYDYRIGTGSIVRDGSDLTIIALGHMVHIALQAAVILERQNISARVINMHTVQPLDQDLVLKCAEETKYIFTLEEHSVRGGLGSAVAEIMACHSNARLKIFGINGYSESGGYSELLAQNQLDSGSISTKIINSLQERRVIG